MSCKKCGARVMYSELCPECEDQEDVLTRLRQRVEELEDEIGHIDSILARRPALADCPTRAAKIERAINVAKNADRLTTERDEAREAILLAREFIAGLKRWQRDPNVPVIEAHEALTALTRHADGRKEKTDEL